jgi:hypothetical protein
MKNPSHLAIAINGVDSSIPKFHFWRSGLIQRLNRSSPSSRGVRDFSRKSQIDSARGLFAIRRTSGGDSPRPWVAQPKADPLICQRTKIAAPIATSYEQTLTFKERSLGHDPKSCHVFFWMAFAVILLSCAATPILAQDSGKTTTEKWRPKDGVYASPGKDFVAGCEESAYLAIELAKKRVGGNEWSCDITKITDTAPGAVKLDMSCNDYNLGLDIKDPNPYERKFREIMLLSKIDAKTLFVRKTSNGKFRDTRWRASYCPDEQQRIHTGEALKPWHPRDGIYASSGANFDERCLKPGDTIVDFAGKTISSGADRCEIYSYDDPLLIDPTMDVVCNETPSTKGLVTRNGMYGPPGFEVLRLKRIDDKTIFLQKTHNGQFSEPGHQVSYCGDEAQRR